ncbi:MAG: hypothetical protein J6I46_01750 [Ruminococcus sp.]|nr:hypothetical protein [Ruminococcus sp.]
MDVKDIKETVEKIDKAIPDEVKEQAKKLATNENLEKAKDIAQDVIKKVTDKK